ncbi:hypothetical protein [Undibacterium sp. Di24W]|uniref:hypothetical protein n=1 Tax=Undibacterium sp. Di24W TaxID=3413033 RepID=UPI003BF19C58
MQIIIYDKTDKGREEIATRKWHLPSRMRSLLVLIDGKQSDAQLVKKTGGLGLSEQSLVELQENGFIQRVSIEAAEPELFDGNDTLDSTSPATNSKLADSTLGSIEESQTIFEASEEETAAWRADLDALLKANEEDNPRESRVDMMKRYLAELIKENLGIKGFFLQRKLLKAGTLYDIHAFRQPYISAILHAKGKDKAIALRDEFDGRMYVIFSIDDPEFLED